MNLCFIVDILALDIDNMPYGMRYYYLLEVTDIISSCCIIVYQMII